MNVTPNVPCYFEDAQGDDRLVYKRLQASDCGNQNLKQYFQEATAFIGELSLAVIIEMLSLPNPVPSGIHLLESLSTHTLVIIILSA